MVADLIISPMPHLTPDPSLEGCIYGFGLCYVGKSHTLLPAHLIDQRSKGVIEGDVDYTMPDLSRCHAVGTDVHREV